MARINQLVVAMAAVLVCAYALPMRVPRQSANRDQELSKLKSGLRAANRVLVSKF